MAVEASKGTGRECPNCKSTDVRRSQMTGFLERSILRIIGIRAYRCERCDQRRYGFANVDRWSDEIRPVRDEKRRDNE